MSIDTVDLYDDLETTVSVAVAHEVLNPAKRDLKLFKINHIINYRS